MGAKKSVQDLRTREEREAAKRDFEVQMRQAAMEFDALDTQQDADGFEGAGSDKQLDFLEFSRLVREREIGIHPEDYLHARFEFLDADGSGSIDVAEYMSYALQDAFERSAASLTDLFAAWDKDGNMQLDRDEFRDALRSYGFKADDEIIDRVFNDFVTSSLGTVSLTDLQFRLRLRNLARPRPLNQLRCLQWREGAEKASVVSRALVNLDKLKPGSTIKDQIKHVLKAQVSRVMDLFRAWDTSGDGLISKHEFRAVVEALGFPVLSQTDFLMLPAEARKSGSDGVPRAAVDALFRELDKDGSGEMDYHEMKDAIDPPPEEPEPGDKYDFRGWGALKKREKAISMAERSRGSAIVKNIKLSPDYDIIAQLAAGLAANWAKMHVLFEQWDIDLSGSISRKELHFALHQLGLEAHPQAIDTLFNSMDVDGSGEVSYDEFELAIHASLRAASSALLKSLQGGASGHTGASDGEDGDVDGLGRLPAIISPRGGGDSSVQLSPRNRVGKIGGELSFHQHLLKEPWARKSRGFDVALPQRSQIESIWSSPADAASAPHSSKQSAPPSRSQRPSPRGTAGYNPPCVPRPPLRMGEPKPSPRRPLRAAEVYSLPGVGPVRGAMHVPGRSRLEPSPTPLPVEGTGRS